MGRKRAIVGNRTRPTRSLYLFARVPAIVVFVPLVAMLVLAVERGELSEDGRRLARGTTLDLGTLDSTPGFVLARFIWHNDRGHALKIAQIVPKCKCMKVQASQEEVEPEGFVSFDADIDARGAQGHFRTEFSVLFDDGQDAVEFSLSLFRPIPPTAKPEVINFGRRINRAAVVRHLDVEVLVDPDPGSVEPVGPATSTDSRVTCRYLKTKKVTVMAANPTGGSVAYVARFEVTLHKNERRNEVKGLLTVPLRIGSVHHNVEVPFSGGFAAELSAQPAQVVRIVTGSKDEDRTVIKLLKDQAGRKIEKITCTASDPRVQVALVADRDVSAETVGALSVACDVSGHQSFDASIDVTAECNGREISLSVPLKVRVVGAQRAGSGAASK